MSASRLRTFGKWLTLALAVGALVALIGSLALRGEQALSFLLAFVVLFPAALISAFLRWWPSRLAEGGSSGGKRWLNLSALGLLLAALLCLIAGVTWFGKALGTLLLVAGALLLPPATILGLLAYSLHDRERLAETALEPGERIVYQAEVHWGVFLPPILVLTASVLLAVGPFGIIGTVVATALYLILLPGMAAHALSVFLNTELELSQHQLVAATGLLVQSTRVLPRRSIQAVGVNQGWLGWLLGYGRISFIFKDGSSFKVPGVVDPEGFRQIVGDDYV
ncbi:PH domain-containing protein [Halorhodospira neutriphila]|uniref:YdbS-like PH domain-containing protein n=1 Tax=Halorhodospira neutriphila TaxID=168379 RepID=A0ABS1E4Q6_9GAMM|nr:PH domain-containing protein [Halorhodospira neutriphila]MBK1726735.1 hypothetical protein [Halorhodospira neutriphila]